VRAPIHRAVVAALAWLLLLSPAPARADLDGFNRWAHDFNRTLEDAFVRPAFEGFRDGAPGRLQGWVANAFGNLVEPVNALAHVLDANLRGAAESGGRFAINSTLGLLGTADVAARMGVPRNPRSLPGALCRRGIPIGTYVVLPLIGPTTAGVAIAATTVLIGTTWLASLVSLELAVASVVVDLVGTAGALEGTVNSIGQDSASYDAARLRYIEELDRLCAEG
jgi:phospholipid-binding lipoprotein MlaA